MCRTPVMIPNVGPVPCRNCKLCRDNRINDWVGRCIAEAKTSDHSLAVTLTYGGDDRVYGLVNPEATVLSYTDVQGYLKRLRKWTPARIRFFVTGEFGTRKQRAHWHMLVFLKGGLVPNLRLGERYVHDDGAGHPLWPQGVSYWDMCDVKTIRYIVKYIQKQDNEATSLKALGLSTKPPLGDEYFKLEAIKYANQGLSPQSLLYRHPEYRLRDGRIKEFKLAGSPAYNFLAAFDRAWQDMHGNENWPHSDLMDAYCDMRDRIARVGRSEPDWPEDYFLERMEMERLEKRGKWQSVIDAKQSGQPVVVPTQKAQAALLKLRADRTHGKG